VSQILTTDENPETTIKYFGDQENDGINQENSNKLLLD